MKILFLYISSIIPILWGIAHLIPTKNVVAGFGDLSEDNHNIITMEWIVEGVSFILIGLLMALVTFIDPFSAISNYVYLLLIAGLLSFAVLSFFTGFKINFLPFRMCPLVLITSSVLAMVGVYL